MSIDIKYLKEAEKMMKIGYKVMLLIVVICTLTVKLQAQSTPEATLVAKVIDAQSNETVPYATASILDRKTKAVVKVAQTDVNGNLKITGLRAGEFTFKISYIGYQTMVRDPLNIASPKEINLGTIKMSASKGTALKEVEITAQKSTMQLGIDKKVFSVDQSLVSEGGSASDLLQNVPTIQSDMDGNVSLRGSAGVKVLIDGKESLIAGGNVAQILQSIPASSIETVEVITNPSAKYDAEGQSGIINIVLKKNKKLGLNGSVALSAGNMDSYNGNANLSFQNNKVNLYGNYSYRTGDRLSDGYNNITYKDSSFPTAFANQNSNSRGTDKGHNVKAGIDYYLAPKTIVSLSGGFNIRDNNRSESLNINKLNGQGGAVELSRRLNNNERSGDSYDVNLDFSQKFKKPNEELTFNFGYSKGNNDSYQSYNTNIFNENGSDVDMPIGINTNTGIGDNKNYNIQADYVLPLSKTAKFEAGYRSQIRYSDNNTIAQLLNNSTGAYDMDYQVSNDFDSKDQVHAIYANYQNQIKNFGYQIGLRGEDATLNTSSGAYSVNGVAYTPGKVAYTRLYPSVYLTQKLKAEQQIQLSYSRRVNRPRGWDTNPFLDVSEPLSYRQGNPNLRPEDVHAYEFSYNKFWPKVTFISSVYFRQTNDVIQRFTRSLEDQPGVTLTTPENLTRERSTGLEMIGKIDVLKAWNFTANVNLFERNIQAVPAYGIKGNSGFSWDANVTNNITLPHKITLQIRADYRAPQVMAQGKRNAMFGMDAGAKYDFPNKQSSLSLNVRNVLNTRNWSMTSDIPGAITDFKRYMQGPVASLTYSYRFGQTTFKAKKQRRPDQGEQQGPDEGSF